MINLAIVGTGGMANTHANNYKKIKGVRLVACCDVLPGRAQEFAEKHGIPAHYTDYNKMLKEADFVGISNVTSDPFHAPLSLQAIAAGKHVLCEKPLATNYADAKKMAVAAKKAGVIHVVNLSYRNSAAINKAAEMIQSGRFGPVRHVSAHYLQSWIPKMDFKHPKNLKPSQLWRLSSKHGSKGVLGDLGVHILDFLSFPAGAIRSVQCRFANFPKTRGNRVGAYVLDANDSAAIVVELEGGAIGCVHTTRYAAGHGNSLLLEVSCEHGAVKVDLDQSYDTFEIHEGKMKPTGGFLWKTVRAAKVPNIYQRFVTGIKTGKQPMPDFARGAEIQKALDACFTSAQTGKPVRV